MKNSENHAAPCQQLLPLALSLTAGSGQASVKLLKYWATGWTEPCCVYCSTVIAWNSPLIARVPPHRPTADIENIWELSVRRVWSWRAAWKMRPRASTGWTAGWSFHLCVWLHTGNWAFNRIHKAAICRELNIPCSINFWIFSNCRREMLNFIRNMNWIFAQLVPCGWSRNTGSVFIICRVKSSNTTYF